MTIGTGFRHTVPGGTDTVEGFIPHREHRSGFTMPVAITIHRHASGLPLPVRYGNAYEWVLPGGRRYVE